MKSETKWAGIGFAFALAGTIGGTSLLERYGLGEPERVALAIVSAAAVLWVTEAIPIFTTSLLVLFLSLVWLRPVLPNQVPSSDFTSPFFSDVILLFLGGFVLAAALRKFRLDELLATWVIARCGESVPRLMAGVLVATAFLSMWLSNTATAAMMLALVFPILRLLPEETRARKALVLCVPFGANIGGLGTPIGSPPNAIAMQYLRELHDAPGFLTWIALSWPLMVVMLVAAWLLLLGVFGGRGERIARPPDDHPVEFTRRSYLVVGVALVTVLGWVSGGVHGLSTGTVALIPVIVLFGTRTLTQQDFRTLSWDILVLMGGGLCLGVAMDKSGLASWFVAQISADALPVMAVVFIVAFVAIVMSSLMSNTATANLLMPIAMGLSGDDPSLMLVAIAFACSLAMALPISTPPNAIAFGSGELTTADMFKLGGLLSFLGIILVVVATEIWWPLFPGMSVTHAAGGSP